mmetsp:Transcript_25653/g.60856  ORF Transcript_25653/g.60856 Transcript_25653/m.60856 type:complete len:270 (+) Transcript_25653:843-1652(+)
MDVRAGQGELDECDGCAAAARAQAPEALDVGVDGIIARREGVAQRAAPRHPVDHRLGVPHAHDRHFVLAEEDENRLVAPRVEDPAVGTLPHHPLPVRALEDHAGLVEHQQPRRHQPARLRHRSRRHAHPRCVERAAHPHHRSARASNVGARHPLAVGAGRRVREVPGPEGCSVAEAERVGPSEEDLSRDVGEERGLPLDLPPSTLDRDAGAEEEVAVLALEHVHRAAADQRNLVLAHARRLFPDAHRLDRFLALARPLLGDHPPSPSGL